MSSSDWESFWDLGSPQEASAFLVEEYGSKAATHAAECALAARSDGRDEDYRFWTAVFHHLRDSNP